MKIEDQVCSLEYSKRLCGLGVKQKSLFFWVEANHPNEKSSDPHISYQSEKYNNTAVTDGWTLTSWSAFTVAELGEMLPREINMYGIEVHCRSVAVNNGIETRWYIQYTDNGKALTEYFSDMSEANSRTKMLIYLLENKLMELPNGT